MISNKLWIRIAFFIAIICSLLLLTVNFFATRQLEMIFVVGSDSTIIPNGNDFDKIPLTSSDEPEPAVRFKNILNLITLIAILLSIPLGIICSWLITKPLNHLNTGLKNLRENNYRLHLSKTGTEEFDTVVIEFNALVKHLEETEILRKNLISDTSHELKTPLSTLLLQIEAINSGLVSYDAKKEVVLDQVQRLLKLVEMLQEYSVLRSKTVELHCEQIPLYPLVEKIKELNAQKLEENQVVLHNKINKHFSISADPLLLERILVNIIDNGIKHSQGTMIEIEANTTILRVSDNGIGIKAEDRSLIFERFFRANRDDLKSKGLGLGLAIVKEMIDAHGWEIEVQPNTPHGTIFIINFRKSQESHIGS